MIERFLILDCPILALPLWPIVVAPHRATLEGTRYTHTVLSGKPSPAKPPTRSVNSGGSGVFCGQSPLHQHRRAGKHFLRRYRRGRRRSAAPGCCLPTLAQWALVPSSRWDAESDIAATINLNGTRLVRLGGFASSATIGRGGIQDNRIRRQRGGTVRGRLGGTRASACQQPQLASPSPSAPSSRCVPASCSPTNTVGAVPLSNC